MPLKVKEIGVISDDKFNFLIIESGSSISGTYDPKSEVTTIDSIESANHTQDVFVRVYRHVGCKTYVLKGRLMFEPTAIDDCEQPVALFDATGVEIPHIDLSYVWVVLDPDFRVYENNKEIYSWPKYSHEDEED